MRRTAFLLISASVLLAVSLPAAAAVRDIDVGNYYFEDVQTGNREVITANEGDQLRFTVRQQAYTQHDVVIDGYGDEYESGPLLLLETFTTPALNKPGTFAMYCRAHRRRGHEAKLVVKETSRSSPAPTSPPKKTTTPKPAGSGAPQASPSTTSSAEPGLVASPGASPSLAPAGKGVATDRRLASPDANSLAGILGRDIGGDEPWTTAVWTWLLAAIPIAALSGYAMRRSLQR